MTTQQVRLFWTIRGILIKPYELFDGDDILNVNSPTLTLENVTAAEEGEYSCYVSNDLGYVETEKATLTVNDPIITVQPVGQSVTEGEAISLSITAVASGNLTYQWYHNNQPLADSDKISGSTSSDLHIAPAELVDIATYYCIVDNGMKSLQSNIVAVNLSELPGGTYPVADSIILNIEPIYETIPTYKFMGSILRENVFDGDGFTVTGLTVNERSGGTRTLSSASVEVQRDRDGVFHIIWVDDEYTLALDTDLGMTISLSYMETVSSVVSSNMNVTAKNMEDDDTKIKVEVTGGSYSFILDIGETYDDPGLWEVSVGDKFFFVGNETVSRTYTLEKGEVYDISMEWAGDNEERSYNASLHVDTGSFITHEYRDGAEYVIYNPGYQSDVFGSTSPDPPVSFSATIYVSNIKITPDIVPYQQVAGLGTSSPPMLDKTYTATYEPAIPGMSLTEYTWNIIAHVPTEGDFVFIDDNDVEVNSYTGQTATIRAKTPATILEPDREGSPLDVSYRLNTQGGITPPFSHIYTKPFNIVPFKIDLAVDGNRDGAVDFNEPEDRSCRFWANDDNDSGESDKDYLLFNDSSDIVIDCKRDLEDFMRLNLQVIPGDLPLTSYMGANNGLSVNIFVAAGSNSEEDRYPKHIFSETNAEAQLDIPLPLRVSSAKVKMVRWTSDRFFLFEARKPTIGFGSLSYQLDYKGAKVGETSVAMDIDNIEDFYDLYSCVDKILEDPIIPTRESGAEAPSTGDDSRYILHLHGWNNTESYKAIAAATTYKRLWWRGYKGRFGIFKWPGAASLLTIKVGITYNEGELISWKSGKHLKTQLEALRTDYPKVSPNGNLFVTAHSQGNVAVGEALKQYSDENPTTTDELIDGYIAMQAATSTHLYDQNYPGTVNFIPNSYAYYPSGDYYNDSTITGVVGQWDKDEDIWADTLFEGTSGVYDVLIQNPPPNYNDWQLYRGTTWDTPNGTVGTRDADSYLDPTSMARACGGFYNFFNPDDWALNKWVINNALKPDDPYYGFSTQDHFYKEEWHFIGREILTFNDDQFGKNDRFEIFAHCMESRSLPLGQSENVGGAFSNDLELNLSDSNLLVGFNGDAAGHSRQWGSFIQKQNRFWYYVLQRFGIPQTYSTVAPDEFYQ